MKKQLILSVLISFFCLIVNAEKIKTAYLDKNCNSHIVTLQGKDVKVTKDGRSMRLSISPNNEIVAWLVKDYIAGENGMALSPSELALYENGKIRAIECQQIIRRYWFWKNGENVAIDCGGFHFAGRETLYDARTLNVLDSFDQGEIPVEQRPIWSESRIKLKTGENKR